MQGRRRAQGRVPGAPGLHEMEGLMEDLSGSTRMHKVSMTNRRSCVIGGVNDVLSFDIHEIEIGRAHV